MGTQSEVVEPPKREPEPPAERGAPRRVQIAQILAFVALLAAFVAALGPAEPIRTTYSWPPRTLPQGNPSTVWYTPLLLTHRIPESVSADLPCRVHPLRGGDGPVTVLATARTPDVSNGLAVTASGRRLTVSIGTQVLHQVMLPARTCSLRLAIANGAWSVSSDVEQLSAAGRIRAMPTVNGLFSEVDFRSGKRPSVNISVIPQSARPVLRQTIAWTIAAACGLLALLLVVYEPARRRRPRASALRRALKAAHPSDAAVVGLLLVWWVLSPANPDDGWVATTERMFQSSGGFSNYFDALATNLPLGYWLEWLQHWLTERTTALVFFRAPAVVCLIAAWALCRWSLARVLGARSNARAATVWGLAAMFIALSFSWDMTLRPEPTIALLTAGALAATIAFAERQTVLRLTLGLLCIVLAVAIHPAGIVSAAPLLAVAPTAVRWARSHFSVAATLVPAAIALAVTVATVGSDVSHRARDVTTFRTYGDATLTWRDELLRYEYLTYPFFGTPLRRASIALLALVVLAYLVRVRRTQSPLLDLPSRALVISLALLVLNPDKLSWHFGTLLALGAVAAGCETSRLREEGALTSSARALPYVWIAGAVVVAAWSWPLRRFWDSFDLRTLDWTLGFESHLPLATVAAFVPLAALLVVALVRLVRAGRRDVGSAPARVAPWSVALVVVPLLVFTMGVLAADAVKTESWTLTRQNLGALGGRAGCGLADDLVTPAVASLRPLPLARPSLRATQLPSWVPPAPIATSRFALGPLTSGSVQTPWFDVRATRPLAVLADGAVAANTKLELEFARVSGGRTHVVATEPLSAGTFQRGLQDMATWLFMAPSVHRATPRRANAVRIAMRATGITGEAIAVTAPVTYATQSLARALAPRDSAILTNPFILPYFPCLREPTLRGGVVEAPSAVVSFPSARVASPAAPGQSFTGVSDVYPLVRLPLVDRKLQRPGQPLGTGGQPIDLVLYDVEPIPGALLAPPRLVSST